MRYKVERGVAHFMQIIADLQLHSKYSRAVSPEMVIPKMYEWNLKKGIGLLATGDWTHPLWFKELKAYLTERGDGLLELSATAKKMVSYDPAVKHSNPLFLLSGEVSCIYRHNDKTRRNHLLLFAPSFSAVEHINKKLIARGCNLSSDGRPIIGLTSQQVCEVVWGVSEDVLVIPAHCLLPSEHILTKGFLPRPIKDIRVGDQVFTHTGKLQVVTELKKRSFSGTVYHVQPWYFRPGLITTSEHPYWAIKTLKKCPSTGDMCRPSKAHLARCNKKVCLSYKPEWLHAENLEVGDVLVYPRARVNSYQTTIQVSKIVSGVKVNDAHVMAGGTRGRKIIDQLHITPELGRLIGYYLAEGSTNGVDAISFCFSEDEKEYIDDLLSLMGLVFGLVNPHEYTREGRKSFEITYYSKIHALFFASICYSSKNEKRAYTKQIPLFLLNTVPEVQAELLRGWYRGDKGYTSSRTLMNQMKALCLTIDIIPSIIVDSKESHEKRGNHQYENRTITARHNSYSFSNFAFFADTYDLKKEISRSNTKLDRRHGWIDADNVYLPIKEIKKNQYEGDVYNLEIEHDHSYVAEFATVHNCWTPWFSVFGSMSGYDSLSECFGPYADRIYAVETGLSSDPAMNWRIGELDTRTVLSCSDSHSGIKLMREATIFETVSDTVSYAAIGEALKNYQRDTTKPHIFATIEFYPEEGKYHFDGHRNCHVRMHPSDTKKKGKTCHVCGKPMTIGVMHRIEDLATRSEASLQLTRKELPGFPVMATYSNAFPHRAPYIMMVPLAEIIAESVSVKSISSKKVTEMYNRLVSSFGGEFTVLFKAKKSAIAHIAGERIADGIQKVRSGDIVVEPGYDGVFGTVQIWKEDEGSHANIPFDGKEQMSLF